MFTIVRFLPPAAAVAAVLLLASCSALTVLDAVTPTSGYRLTADVAYGPGPRLQLDVYVPAPSDAPRAAPAPVVVFFYGGTWVAGSKRDYRFVGQALASRGVVTVIADYRLFPDAPYPVFLEDCAAALAWTFRNIDGFGGDPARIVIAGHSAGAYNAAMLAYDPRWSVRAGVDRKRIAGFVGLAGPYDFLPIGDPTTQRVFGWPGTPRDSQPIHHVSADDPRSLLIVANGDRTVVPERNTEPLARALASAGVPVEVKRYDGVSHTTLIGAMSPALQRLAPVADEVAAFVLATPSR